MKPHYRRDQPETYISYYAQDALQNLFDELTDKHALVYDKGGVKSIEVKFGAPEKTLFVYKDERDDRTALLMTVEEMKNEPSNVQDFLLNRGLMRAEPYLVTTASGDYEDIIEGVKSVNPELAQVIDGLTRAGYSQEPELLQQAKYLADYAPVVTAWAVQNKQTLKYDGKNQSNARLKLPTFIGTYLEMYVMEGHLVLQHSGSHTFYAYQEDSTGGAWYGVDIDYGYRLEEKLGNKKKINYDKDLDTNGIEHFALKHMFKHENQVATTIDGKLIPVSAKVYQLQLYMSSIVETLNLTLTAPDTPSIT